MLKINLHEIKGIDCYHKFYFFLVHSNFTSVTNQSIPYLYYSLYSCCSSLIFYPLLFHFGFVPSLFIPFQTFFLLSGRNIIFYIILYIYLELAFIRLFTFTFLILSTLLSLILALDVIISVCFHWMWHVSWLTFYSIYVWLSFATYPISVSFVSKFETLQPDHIIYLLE